MNDRDRAQRWHDTDHGPDRKAPSKDTRFRIPINEPEPEWVSSCFCCCERCDPEWEHPRPNPYWTRAMVRVITR